MVKRTKTASHKGITAMIMIGVMIMLMLPMASVIWISVVIFGLVIGPILVLTDENLESQVLGEAR